MSGKMEQYRELYREIGDVPFPEFAATFKERYGEDAAASSYYATKTKVAPRPAKARETPVAQEPVAAAPQEKPAGEVVISLSDIPSLMSAAKLLKKLGPDGAQRFVDSVFGDVD